MDSTKTNYLERLFSSHIHSYVVKVIYDIVLCLAFDERIPLFFHKQFQNPDFTKSGNVDQDVVFDPVFLLESGPQCGFIWFDADTPSYRKYWWSVSLRGIVHCWTLASQSIVGHWPLFSKEVLAHYITLVRRVNVEFLSSFVFVLGYCYYLFTPLVKYRLPQPI